VLVLTRKQGEKILIGDDIVITILDVRGDSIRIGIDAPRGVGIQRDEVVRAVTEANIAANIAASRAAVASLGQFGVHLSVNSADEEAGHRVDLGDGQAGGDALGQLGIVRQRQGALQALAREVIEGRLALHAGADVPSTLVALQALPGIGDWTAQYIAMRALRWPDAFPAGDVALHKALGTQRTPSGQPSKTAARDAEALSQAWKPWRSYAVIRAWASLPAPASTVSAASKATKAATASKPEILLKQ